MRSQRPSSVQFDVVTRPIHGRVCVPGSKSITNRALICAAMARGESLLHGALDSEDTEVMVQAWQQLGVPISWDRGSHTIRVVGCGGQPSIPSGQLFIANSGTSIRFLTAALAATRGHYTLDGVARMRERPIGDLIAGLQKWGANIRSLNSVDSNCPPVQLLANCLDGGEASVRGDVSSQFLSGMLMAAPYCRTPVFLKVMGELVSKPYVKMTLEVMRSFGVQVRSVGDNEFEIDAPQSYVGTDYAIEPDASAASYFMAVAAITGGKVRIEGLSLNALQGDVQFAKVLERMGCSIESTDRFIEVTGNELRGIDIDMNSISDTVQTLAMVALFANGPTRIRGVAHNRHKETDRIGDLAREVRKLGANVVESEDGMTITPSGYSGCTLETYHDHRMAMSFSLACLKIPAVKILDPRCTEKTYPNYFDDFGRLIEQQPKYA